MSRKNLVNISLTYVYKNGDKDTRDSTLTLEELTEWLNGHEIHDAHFTAEVEAE